MRNTLKTFVFLAALGGLFLAVGAAIGGQTGLLVGLVLGLALVGGSYWFSDTIAVKAARARPVTEQELPEYHAIVRELCLRADMPVPKLYVTPERQPNAFATGRNPDHAAVAVTQGILQALTWDELRGVLAHELSHVKNRDVLIGSVAAAVAMAVTFAARIAAWGALFTGGGGGDRDGGGVLGFLATIVLAPVAAFLLQMAVSRSREYEADASGAELLGDGEPLARALEKLDAYAERIPAQVAPEQAYAYIVNPLRGSRAAFAGLFSSHPPMARRVARLRAARGPVVR